jgi:hypothetical protein
MNVTKDQSAKSNERTVRKEEKKARAIEKQVRKDQKIRRKAEKAQKRKATLEKTEVVPVRRKRRLGFSEGNNNFIHLPLDRSGTLTQRNAIIIEDESEMDRDADKS